jgi:predicted metal-dependent phosphoesterase TrpH
MDIGLTAFALTDHDTVEGIDEAISFAHSINSDKVPEVIPGIEFSTEWSGRDVHVVGLAIDHHNESFCGKLKFFIDSRDGRNEKMAKKLASLGIGITYEGMLSMFPNCVLTRAHFARYLQEYGYVKSSKEAFERYLGPGCPGYVPREKVTPVQAVEMALEAGGIPVLAHPMIYNFEPEELDRLIAEMKAAGLVGIEALYCTHTQADERYVRSLADKYGLAISGGSDFHGENKPGLEMGTGYGSLSVPDFIWPELKKAAGKN